MTTPVARPGRCWYCGESSLAVGDPPEHVIPAAIGGTLTTDRVCAKCNEEAGKRIDHPFLGDWFIANDRQLLDVRDTRRRGSRPVRPPKQTAQLPDGTPVDLTTNDGPWTARVRSSLERDGDQVRIRAADRAEYERLLAKLRRQLEAEGRTLPDIPAPQEEEITDPVEVTTEVNGVVWLRMAAKVTLATLSLVLDEAWLDTQEAAKYRGWLWDDDPRNPDGSPALGLPGDPSPFEAAVVKPPEHLLYFAPHGRDVTGFSVIFFGLHAIRARVELLRQRQPRCGWRTGPKGAPRPFTWDQLLTEMAAPLLAQREEPPAG